jgi:hypothetical protein
MKINVYIGVIGSGKDYRAKQDCDIQLAFADQLREDVWKIIGWKPKTQDEYEIFKNSTFYSNGFGEQPIFTGRDLLQRYGTEVRRAEDNDHWCKRLTDNLALLGSAGTKTVGVTDCRFDNEIRRLIKFKKDADYLGIDVQLEFIHADFKSERYNATSEHESEKLAQQFVGKVFTEGEFNKLIFEMYE